jgi:hypothetical protein
MRHAKHNYFYNYNYYYYCYYYHYYYYYYYYYFDYYYFYCYFDYCCYSTTMSLHNYYHDLQGKTLTTKIIASESNKVMVHLPVESIASKWHGDSEKNMSQVMMTLINQ